MSNWADSVDEIIDQPSPHQAEAAPAPSPSTAGSDEPAIHSSSSGYRGEPRKIPDHAPFQARLRNLVYSLTKEDIKDWFVKVAKFDEDDILSTEVIMDRTGRASGVAIVEFKDRESLVKALSFDGEDVLDRPLQVMPNLPNRPRGHFGSERRDRYPERRDDRYSDRRDREDRGGYERRDDRAYDRRDRYDRREDRGSYDRRDDRREDHRGFGGSRSFGYDRRDRDEHRERQEPPKLNLQPRSAAPAAAPSSSSSSKSDPFGGAKPVDTAKVEQEKLTAYKVKEVEKKPAAKHDTDKAPAAEHKSAATAAPQEKQQTSSSLSESSSPSEQHQKSPVRGGDFSSRGTRGRGEKRGGRGAGRGAAASTERSWRDEPRPKAAGRGEQKTRAAKTTTAKPAHTSTANKFASLEMSDD